MDELNFAPSALVRGLRERRTGIIGVGSNGLDSLDQNPGGAVTPPLLSGFNVAANRHKLNILLFNGWEGQEGNVRWSQFLDGHIDGLLWVDPGINEPALVRIAGAGFPVVGVLTRHVPAGVGFVNADNVGSIVSVVRHLFELGHRKIAYAGAIDKSNYLDRWTGYREGLTEVGLPFDKSLEATATSEFWTPSKLLAAVERLLALPERPTAIILPDDRTAISVIELVQERGLKVPEDISVVGFDDVPDAQIRVAGGLTTVRQEFRAIAETALDQLVKLIAGAPAEECRVTIPTRLIVRGSTGPLSQA
jgi:DNA-binding LacI/PurR family transcriptional regulator